MLSKGRVFSDERGRIIFNNDFDASLVKRIYFIQNNHLDFVRGWQGHQIEQRWFVCVNGSFRVKIIRLDNFDHPSKDLPILSFELNDQSLDVFHVPAGYVTSLQAITPQAKLMAMSDYHLGEINDEYRYEVSYFNQI